MSSSEGNYENVIGDDAGRYDLFKREMEDEIKKYAPSARVTNVRPGSIIVDVSGPISELVKRTILSKYILLESVNHARHES